VTGQLPATGLATTGGAPGRTAGFVLLGIALVALAARRYLLRRGPGRPS
jgi:hypothetical protein